MRCFSINVKSFVHRSYSEQKSGSGNQIGNYRGIAILPTIAKVFEKLVNDFFTNYGAQFDTYDQHGFTASRSVVLTLVLLLIMFSRPLNR